MPKVELNIGDTWGLDRDLASLCAEARAEAERGAPVDPDLGSSAMTFGRAAYVTFCSGVVKVEGEGAESLAVDPPYTVEAILSAAREALRLNVAALRTRRATGQTLYWRRFPDVELGLGPDGLRVKSTMRAVYQ